MFNLDILLKQSIWAQVSIITIIFIILSGYFGKNKENFMFTPWNMGTRFYPSYDIRGYPPMYNQLLNKDASYPLLFPWNYPYPGLPYLFWSPHFYEATGKYTTDKKFANLLTKILTTPVNIPSAKSAKTTKTTK